MNNESNQSPCSTFTGTELWISRAEHDANAWLSGSEPELHGKTFIGGENWIAPVPIDIPPGHKAKLTIGEPIDCRPKPVPELWAWHYMNGRSYIGLSWAMSVMLDEGSHTIDSLISRMHKCRIAIDEHGIRLIGEPVPI